MAELAGLTRERVLELIRELATVEVDPIRNPG
jgi:hypothetical protein